MLSTWTQMENLLGHVRYFGEIGALNPLNGQEATR